MSDIDMDRKWKVLCEHCRVDIHAKLKFSTRISLKHRRHPIKLGKQNYCSQLCLENHLQSLRYPGAVHHVHQTFGPDHPVTKQIQKMYEELKLYHRSVDVDRRRLRGKFYFEKYLEKSNKCL